MKRQIITIIIALILGVVTAQADILKGRVVDADTGEPLQGAEVVFIEKDTRWGDVLQTTIRTDSVGRFQRACEMEMSKLTITCHAMPQGQVPDIFQLVNVIVSVIVSFLFTKLQRSFLRKTYPSRFFDPLCQLKFQPT